MDGAAVTCWYEVFRDAYKYSSNYLIFTLSLILTSILLLWIYEKPQIYKLLFKRSKHSNILSPLQSLEHCEENSLQNTMAESNNISEEKKSRELSKHDMEF